MSKQRTRKFVNKILRKTCSSLVNLFLTERIILHKILQKLAGQNHESIFQEAIYGGILVRNSSRYEAFEKLLLKSHLGIKCHSQYIKVIRLLQPRSANSWWGWQGMHCAWPGDYQSFSLTRIQFHPPKVTPFTTLAEVTVQGLCCCKSSARGWHNG